MAGIKDLVKGVEDDGGVFYEESGIEAEITPGTYEATIIGLRKRIKKTTKNGGVCDLFWPRYRIDGPDFEGRILRDRGLFRYYDAGSRNSNVHYKKFLENLGISLNKKEINGKIRYLLPLISLDMIEGKRVIVNVYKEEWNDSNGYHKIPVAKLVREMDISGDV